MTDWAGVGTRRTARDSRPSARPAPAHPRLGMILESLMTLLVKYFKVSMYNTFITSVM